jgi:integrase
MINHIIKLNTTTTATINNLMLATGVALAYFLCLRSSEYVSKTIVPIDDSHQFRSTEVEFLLNDGSLTLIASNKLKNQKFSAFKLVKFSMLHAKNIRRGHGVPIWFSTSDSAGNIVPFVQLLFRWSTISMRLDDDPFLSFRTPTQLSCLLYKDIQSALKLAAQFFNLDDAWFNTHSLRMSAPTIAKAAKADTSTILNMGRWKTVPSAMKYQEQSTASNNNIITMVSNPTLYTAEDIILSRTLASRAPDRKPTVRLP